MKLYSGTSAQFIEDTIQNQIAEKLKTSFFIISDIILLIQKLSLGKTH